MLTYAYVGTNDLEHATRFYDATLVPLGMQHRRHSTRTATDVDILRRVLRMTEMTP